jgi:hypothetical protein
MIGETVTVTSLGTATGADDVQGNPVLGASTTSTFVTLAPVVPITSDETAEDAGTVVVDGFRVFGPADLVLLPSDVLTIRSADYQMEGFVGRYNRSTTGEGRGTVFMVRRV